MTAASALAGKRFTVGRLSLQRDALQGITVACWFIEGRISSYEMRAAYAYRKLCMAAYGSMGLKACVGSSLNTVKGRSTRLWESPVIERAWRFMAAALDAADARSRQQGCPGGIRNLLAALHAPGHRIDPQAGTAALQTLARCWVLLEKSDFAPAWLPKRL